MKNTPFLLGLGGFLLIVVGAVWRLLDPVHGLASCGVVLTGLLLTGLFFVGRRHGVKEFLARRATGRWANLAVIVSLVTAATVLVYVLSSRHRFRFDLTPDKKFSFSVETRKVIEGLEEDVEVIVFHKGGDRKALDRLMRRYALLSDHFRYRLVEPERHPELAKKYGIGRYYQTVVKRGGNDVIIPNPFEEALALALVQMDRQREMALYFLRGHEEGNLFDADERRGYSQIREEMEKQGFLIHEISLTGSEQVPGEETVLIALGPRIDFTQEEIQKLTEYLTKGGNLILALDPIDLPNLAAFMLDRGLRIVSDVLVDPQQKMLGGSDLLIVARAPTNTAVTQDMHEGIFFPIARSVRSSKRDGVETYPLAMSSPMSWAEANLESALDGEAVFDPDEDKPGPYPVASLSSPIRETEGEEEESHAFPSRGKVVVFGDSDFINNHYLNIAGNKQLFLKSVNYLSGGEVSLPASRREAQLPAGFGSLFLSAGQARLLFSVLVLVEPSLFILAGVLVFFYNRRTG